MRSGKSPKVFWTNSGMLGYRWYEMRTFQFRLYPDKSQTSLLWQHANKLNWVYNYFLQQRITAYQNEGKTLSKFDQIKQLPELKENDPLLSAIHSQVIQQAVARLDNAYKAFFRRVKQGGEAPGFPKFRSCRNFFGITYPQKGYWINDNVFKTKAYGKIKFAKHRDILGTVKQVSITNKNNRFYLNVTTDYEGKDTQEKPTGEVGIDLGLKNLVVSSDGFAIPNQTDAKYFDKQIANLQSQRDKLKKGSRKYRYLSRTIRRLYERKTRKVRDFQHKVSKTLSSKYDTIYAEDLSVKTMSEGNKTNLNKAVRNASFGQFISYLQYKVNTLVLVNPKNTSKTCNHCGYIHANLRLDQRILTCPDCGETYDRDENASKNILCLGQAMQASPAYAGSKLTIQEALAFKRE